MLCSIADAGEQCEIHILCDAPEAKTACRQISLPQGKTNHDTISSYRPGTIYTRVAATVQIIGSKWKLLIMRNLMQRPWRFNELRKDLEGISQKVLTDSLRSMESDGIITRTVYPEVPPRVEYALSALGESMRPIMDAMEEWGRNYKKQL